MNSLLALLDREAGNGDQFPVAERSEHRRTAEPIREPTQRLGIFNLKGATERFRIDSESLQSNISIQGRISRIDLRQAPYLDVNCTHVLSSLEVPEQPLLSSHQLQAENHDHARLECRDSIHAASESDRLSSVVELRRHLEAVALCLVVIDPELRFFFC